MKQVMQRNEYNLNKNKQTMIAITLIGEKKKNPSTFEVVILRLVDTIITRCQCLSTLPREAKERAAIRLRLNR